VGTPTGATPPTASVIFVVESICLSEASRGNEEIIFSKTNLVEEQQQQQQNEYNVADVLLPSLLVKFLSTGPVKWTHN
jgi:hypothetical protein